MNHFLRCILADTKLKYTYHALKTVLQILNSPIKMLLYAKYHHKNAPKSDLLNKKYSKLDLSDTFTPYMIRLLIFIYVLM